MTKTLKRITPEPVPNQTPKMRDSRRVQSFQYVDARARIRMTATFAVATKIYKCVLMQLAEHKDKEWSLEFPLRLFVNELGRALDQVWLSRIKSCEPIKKVLSQYIEYWSAAVEQASNDELNVIHIDT